MRYDMAERSKRIHMKGDSLDRISNLQSDVLTQVLDLLPLRDLARTSVLSRKWKYVWASHPNIRICRRTLYIGLREEGETSVLNDLTNITNKILLQHIGPVLKFSLQFPFLQFPLFHTDNDFDFAFVDNWLLYLSRNGIQKISLKCLWFYILPSCIFSAPELVSLKLRKCIFKPPNGQAEFCKLKSLKVYGIDLGSSQITLQTPELTFLRIEHCTMVCHFKILAPKLRRLILNWNFDVDLAGFEMSKITTIAVMGGGSFKEISLTKLFERWPLISSFYVDGQSFEHLVADIGLERLPMMISRIKHLVLHKIDWVDLHQISCILYLLRSSTTLSRLEISAITPMRNATTDVLYHLDEAESMNWTMDNLEIVIIDNTCASEEEMRFLKFLLSRSPKLKKMFVQERAVPIDNDANFKLLEQLMRFTHASMEAEIIIEPNVKVAKLRISGVLESLAENV